MFDSFVAVSDRDKQRALELVLQSRTFVRSEQLRAFLRYVCSMEIEGRGEQITEYRIAVEALGRSQDYATTEDSAVRNRAHALRVKLEELYTKESPDAPVRIDFFKGSYRPHFVVQKSPDENGSVAPVITSAEMAKPQTVEPKLRVLGLFVAGHGAEITWEAEADFESGIGGFVILRDGQELAKLPEKPPANSYGRRLFQEMSYHDTPEPPVAEIRYVDRTAKAAGKHTYAVATINSVGLRSKPKTQ